MTTTYHAIAPGLGATLKPFDQALKPGKESEVSLPSAPALFSCRSEDCPHDVIPSVGPLLLDRLLGRDPSAGHLCWDVVHPPVRAVYL